MLLNAPWGHSGQTTIEKLEVKGICLSLDRQHLPQARVQEAGSQWRPGLDDTARWALQTGRKWAESPRIFPPVCMHFSLTMGLAGNNAGSFWNTHAVSPPSPPLQIEGMEHKGALELARPAFKSKPPDYPIVYHCTLQASVSVLQTGTNTAS